MILAALWFGKSKPVMSAYLEPILNSLVTLKTEDVYYNLIFVCDIHAYNLLDRGTC